MPGKGTVQKGIYAAFAGDPQEKIPAALPGNGDAVLHRNPGERAGLYYGGGGQKEESHCPPERENQDGAAAEGPLSETERLCRRERDPGRQRFCNRGRETVGSKQHPARDEIHMRGSAGGAGKGVSAQSASSLCMHLLRQGKRPVSPGGPSGTFQCEHDAAVHQGERGGTGTQA